MLRVIEGDAHAYVFASPGTKKWDTCAPEAVLVAMGGALTGLSHSHAKWETSRIANSELAKF